MPIRKLILHTCILGVMLPSSAIVRADAASWTGSYVADGTCFCAGSQGRNIDSTIVPTPIGGQSVSQVCERVGKGPPLQKVNGEFNFTVYEDAQCGNGPFPGQATLGDDQVIGPKWDLKSAYSKPASSSEKPLGISDTPAVTGGSRYITPPVKDENTSVAEIASVLTNSTSIEETTPVIVPKAKVAVVPQTREQIRERQLEQIAAARERAKLREREQSAKEREQLAAASERAKLKEQENARKLAEKAKALENAKAVEKAMAAEKARESVETVAKANSSESSPIKETTPVAALKVPAVLRNNSSDFDYLEGAPVNYDFGGAGMSVEASKSSHNRMQYLLNASAAESYQEAAIGVGVFVTPATAQRMTIIARAGLEYGMFNFSRGSIDADVSDTGAFLNLTSRFSVTQKFALQAGIGYSSFFEGDTVASGAAFYNLTRNFDITAKAEAGDNDLLGFGIRYHY